MSASSENKLPQLNYFDPRGPQSSFDEVSFLVAVICTWSSRVIGKSLEARAEGLRAPLHNTCLNRPIRLIYSR